jgi:hypothetical protein
MIQRISGIVFALMFLLTTGGPASAVVRSKFVIVESPSDLPESAQVASEAMHLHSVGSDQVILYLEQDHGRKLAILDVTDPAKIQAVGQVSIDAASPYDFVQDLSDSTVLIHYRDHSGFAVISFKNYKEPVLTKGPDYMDDSTVQSYGAHGLLLVSSTEPSATMQAEQYQVLSTSDSATLTPLATISGVMQRLDRSQTGTIFLLNGSGLNVVRCLATERAHEDSIANHRN